MATKKRRRFNEGGIAADKEAGLKASKGEDVGFFERLRMGNIDQEGSEAYNRFGAGRGKAERTPVEDKKPTPVQRENPPAVLPQAPEMDPMEAANNGPKVPMPVGPKPPAASARPTAKPPVNTAPTKPASSKPAPSTAATTTAVPAASAPPRKYGVNDIPLDAPRTPVKGEKDDSTDFERNAKTMLGALSGAVPGSGSLATVSRMGKAGKTAQTGSRALAKADDGVTFLGKGPRRPMGSAGDLTGPSVKALPGTARKISGSSAKELASPKKRLGYNKAGTIKKMASGGSVSSASKRSDGIAIRGKTNCKMR